MKLAVMVLGITLVLSVSIPVYANGGYEDADIAELMRTVRALQNRVRQLEERLAQQESKVERVEETAAAETHATGQSGRYGGMVFHGLVEVEAVSGDSHTGADSGDVTLATVELGFDFSADWVTGSLLALHEDDEADPWVVDEAFFTIGNTAEFPLYLAAGRMYVPFGNFETSMVSDPLTLELGETREAALQLGFENAGWYGSAYVFNGDLDDMGGDDGIENYGFNIGHAIEGNELSHDFGFSWVNHMGDADLITEELHDAGVASVADYVAGYGLYAVVHAGPWSLIGEYVAASEEFLAAELAWRGDGARPKAYNFEVGYDFVAFDGRESNVAIGVQGTDEAAGLGQPESRLLAVLSTALFENTLLALEYANAEDYGTGDGGADGDGDAVTLQVAVEF